MRHSKEENKTPELLNHEETNMKNFLMAFLHIWMDSLSRRGIGLVFDSENTKYRPTYDALDKAHKENIKESQYNEAVRDITLCAGNAARALLLVIKKKKKISEALLKTSKTRINKLPNTRKSFNRKFGLNKVKI